MGLLFEPMTSALFQEDLFVTYLREQQSKDNKCSNPTRSRLFSFCILCILYTVEKFLES